MTLQPKIPMSPDALPQQRLHEVVTLPERPTKFDCMVGYRVYPPGTAPKKHPRKPIYLCQTEWAWSPMHNRIDAYHLHRGSTHWSLWSRYWDDNWSRWGWAAIGSVHRRGVDERQAAVHLLLQFWKEEAEESDLDQYHWINEDGYLSVAEISAIARIAWG